MQTLLHEIEKQRLNIQAILDDSKTQTERNRMGQFATPTTLALDMLSYAHDQLSQDTRIRFFDPAIGTGSFYSALLNVFTDARIECAVGYEVDLHYGGPAVELWSDTVLDLRIEDFTRSEPPGGMNNFNLLICNPLYVRHHHIGTDEKRRLREMAIRASGIEINGLAGLYCYFVCLSHTWMDDDGLAGWLVPSEFMDVNYGASLKNYLLNNVTLLHIHRFDPTDVQFSDALVSSAVVWFKNRKPSYEYEVRFTFGGSLQSPKIDRLVSVKSLREDPKWTRYPIKEKFQRTDGPVLSDFFTIRRGVGNRK